ncbi:ABC-type transport auxiliary lipoprotein family protein [Simplicispira lacusdiani]|uniref:ABC-type transport auxiliary lipoprotein family protein n=1 Tax=Simplicispira lacusdiani TaxID=2213010 RepID=UPI000E72F54F|nr:ABC-type transport auxiliary lipoprotein family protein [Simplicispira lacusdiani]
MNAINKIANSALFKGVAAVFGLMALAGCAALPEPPARPVLYDFGPGQQAPAGAQAPLPPLALETVDHASLPDGVSAVYYRLAYADAQQLRPYQAARWSQPPQQLMRESLQARLGQRRAIIGTSGAMATARAQGQPPAVLRVELEEFSHVFASPAQSAGLVRLRATLTRPSAQGENLLAQRLFIAQQPAASQDAAGGTRAIAQAAEQVAQDVAQWLESSGY